MATSFIHKSLPETFLKFSTHAFYFSVVPAFFWAFAALYKPFNMSTLLELPRTSYSFNITMMMCIILLVVLSSRMVLYFTRAIRHLSLNWYRVWCFGEILLSAFFVALYVDLIADFAVQYTEVLVATLGYMSLVLVLPYAFLELSFTMSAANNRAAAEPAADAKLHFYDNRHTLKFVVNADRVLYIKADENYVTVNYLEGDKKKSYEMRASMKSLEDTCSANGILRCHRSYFINPQHVKALRKEKENMIVAELDYADDVPIPVSKRYYEDLAAKL